MTASLMSTWGTGNAERPSPRSGRSPAAPSGYCWNGVEVEDGLLGKPPGTREYTRRERVPAFRLQMGRGARRSATAQQTLSTELYEEAAGAAETSLDKILYKKNSSSLCCLNALKLQHAKQILALPLFHFPT